MTTQPLLPFRTTRRNRLFTGVVIVAAGIATAGIAATLQPAQAAVESARQSDSRPAQRAERPEIDKKLTNDQVKDIVEGRLAMSGNPNLKVGKITAKEDGVVSVDITTKTGALVETQEISTKTGLPANAERRVGAMRERFRGHGGPGMMTHRGGHGPGMDQGEKRDLALTADQAKKLAEARLIMRGNPRLKVGAVKEKDADTISIDIVASDNSLVTQQLIDRHTGRPRRS